MTNANFQLISLGIIAYIIVGLISYYWGRRRMRIDLISERIKSAETKYDYAKISFESKDYIKAVEQAAMAIGIMDDLLDNSAAWHILALAQDKLGNLDSAINAHAMAVWYALQYNNPDAALHYFNTAVGLIKKEDFKLAYNYAQRGLSSIERNPSGRYYKNQDFEVELRTIKLICSLAEFPGTKAFEVCKEDAEWLLKNSNDELTQRFAKNFIMEDSNIKDMAKRISDDWLKEISALN